MTNATMRAKLKVCSLERHGEGEAITESLSFSAIYKDSYANDPLDEDNTYARYTPMADLRMSITNPSLIGKLSVGDVFYVDFTRAP